MTTIDISPITQGVVWLCASTLAIFGSWALTMLNKKLGGQISANQKAALDGALHDALTFGITEADATIRANGWDHPTVKASVISTATQYMVDRYAGTLANVGVAGDLSSPANITQIIGALARALPAAALAAAASPVTPPAPPAATVAVEAAP